MGSPLNEACYEYVLVDVSTSDAPIIGSVIGIGLIITFQASVGSPITLPINGALRNHVLASTSRQRNVAEYRMASGGKKRHRLFWNFIQSKRI